MKNSDLETFFNDHRVEIAIGNHLISLLVYGLLFTGLVKLVELLARAF